MLGLTQSEISEHLGVTPQSVFNWERGDTLPDTTMLPDLALILNTSVDELLGGGSCECIYKKRISVERMENAIDCIETLRNLLGEDHFMYRTIIEALDTRMNSTIEATFTNRRFKDAYICEAIIGAVRNGAYIDLDDVRNNIQSERPRQATIEILKDVGVK